jgi:hypothetical protein
MEWVYRVFRGQRRREGGVSSRKVRSGILVIAILGAAAACVGCGSKPTYTSGGRTIAYWTEVLKQPDVEMRRKAVQKIGPLMLMDAGVLPATLAALKDEDVKVRLAAIRSLRLYSGPKAPQAVPALRDVQDNEKDKQVREAASDAIATLTSH